jgi:hypothetical protein
MKQLYILLLAAMAITAGSLNANDDTWWDTYYASKREQEAKGKIEEIQNEIDHIKAEQDRLRREQELEQILHPRY